MSVARRESLNMQSGIIFSIREPFLNIPDSRALHQEWISSMKSIISVLESPFSLAYSTKNGSSQPSETETALEVERHALAAMRTDRRREAFMKWREGSFDLPDWTWNRSIALATRDRSIGRKDVITIEAFRLDYNCSAVCPEQQLAWTITFTESHDLLLSLSKLVKQNGKRCDGHLNTEPWENVEKVALCALAESQKKHARRCRINGNIFGRSTQLILKRLDLLKHVNYPVPPIARISEDLPVCGGRYFSHLIVSLPWEEQFPNLGDQKTEEVEAYPSSALVPGQRPMLPEVFFSKRFISIDDCSKDR